MAALRFDTAGKTKPEVLKTFPDCLHKVDSDNRASPLYTPAKWSCVCHQNDSVHNEDEVSKNISDIDSMIIPLSSWRSLL